jgi:vanillate O-demethylase monooxygenase subunit
MEQKVDSPSLPSAPYLLNCWYVAAWMGELAPGAHMRRVILGQPILFFRTLNGDIAAIGDICPHRFASLSNGRFEDGVVECPYHGLRFDMSGRCVHNPHGDGRIPERARVARYPLSERYGAIWIWPGHPEAADDALIPDLSFLDNPSPNDRGVGYIRRNANYQLMCDNIMDLSHSDFVHRTTLGTDGATARAQAKTQFKRDIVTIEWSFDGKGLVKNRSSEAVPDVHTNLEVTWHAPGVMIIRNESYPIGDENSKIKTVAVHIMTPETETSTHYLFGIPSKSQLDAAHRIFETEDGVMLEDVQRNMQGAALWELNPVILSNDGGAVLSRRVLARKIQTEQDTGIMEVAS